MRRDLQKRIAVINDFCGFGRCSLAVSLPVISALKVQCCPLPTAIFSNHTGYDHYYSADFTPHMEAYIAEWRRLKLSFNGILTGYLGSPEQIGIVKTFLKEFKNPETVAVVDPVMGDNGMLYPGYSSHLAKQMAGLLPFADILTPNLTEACILTDTPFDPKMQEPELKIICEKLAEMGSKKVVISGLERGEDLENFLYEQGKEPVVMRSHKVGSTRAGTGDVFSSVIAADAVNGMDLEESVRHASAFIAKALRRTMELNVPLPDGICFEEFLGDL